MVKVKVEKLSKFWIRIRDVCVIETPFLCHSYLNGGVPETVAHEKGYETFRERTVFVFHFIITGLDAVITVIRNETI